MIELWHHLRRNLTCAHVVYETWHQVSWLTKSDCWKRICYQVNPKQVNWLQDIPSKESCQENCQDFSSIGRKKVLNGLWMFEKTLRPSSTATIIVAKLSSARSYQRQSLLLLPVTPIPMPISAARAGASLTIITRHSNNLTLILPSFDDTNLVFWRYTRINRVLQLLFLNSSSESSLSSHLSILVFRIIFINDSQTLGNQAPLCLGGHQWSWLDGFPLP